MFATFVKEHYGDEIGIQTIFRFRLRPRSGSVVVKAFEKRPSETSASGADRGTGS